MDGSRDFDDNYTLRSYERISLAIVFLAGLAIGAWIG